MKFQPTSPYKSIELNPTKCMMDRVRSRYDADELIGLNRRIEICYTFVKYKT